MERLYNFLKRNLNITKSELAKVISEVRVNGEATKLTKFVSSGDIITYKEEVLTNFSEKHLFLYHKPVGLEVTNNLNNPNSYLNDLKLDYRIFSVGRLDKDSRGLMILTNDSNFYQLMGEYEKEYQIVVDKPINDEDLIKLASGVIIDKDYLTKPAVTRRKTSNSFTIILKEGKNRQIRKMCQSLGYKVIDLFRTRIDKFTIDDLKEHELKELNYEDSLKLIEK